MQIEFYPNEDISPGDLLEILTDLKYFYCPYDDGSFSTYFIKFFPLKATLFVLDYKVHKDQDEIYCKVLFDGEVFWIETHHECNGKFGLDEKLSKVG